MRERMREIKRRRQRYEKRRKLRVRLAAAGTDVERQQIEARIRKTLPRNTAQI